MTTSFSKGHLDIFKPITAGHPKKFGISECLRRVMTAFEAKADIN